MRILLIEDTVDLALAVKAALEKQGFQVDLSHTGQEGEEKAYVETYDVILLDLNLPDKDGLEILHFLRDANVKTPVIIITARDAVAQRTEGLNTGADDYLTKPFDLSELTARIHAVVRRFHGRTSPEIRIGNLIVNPLDRTAVYAGNPLKLKAKEFDMLEFIAASHPCVVSVETIAAHVYGEQAEPSSSVLRVHIARVKKALADAAETEVLRTIRGKGYQLCDK